MQLRPAIVLVLASALLVSGCSVFPGLRVLTGQEDALAPQQAVQAIDLTMADKAGGTSASILLIGDRIEAANPYVDVIEVRETPQNGLFDATVIYLPPQFPNTAQGQRDSNDLLRRTLEVTWQAAIAESGTFDQISITLVLPGQVTTLDSGPAFIGAILGSYNIDRGDAAAYLEGTRSLQTFADLVVVGQLRISEPSQMTFYEGTPNHPLFLTPTTSQ